jgi:dynein assembly factor 1
MSIKFFNKLLSENGKLYYRTYELNDILYLHFKGFRRLENLNIFKNIKVLYLEGNCIKKIEGLEILTQITSLYLHENLIEKIEGLENLKNLYNLNLADNCITKIEGLANLPNLCNVILSRNKIGMNGLNDLKGLLEMEPSVMVVNLENNRITEDNILEEIFIKMPLIRVIYLQGNECLRKISSYRKNFIAKLKELRYLDDRPVFEDERRFAEAFARGGIEEERRERALYKKEKEEKDLQRIKDFQEMIEGWKEGDSEERLKKKEEEKKKLLEKCNSKLRSKETKKENEIFTEEDLDTSEKPSSIQINNQAAFVKDAHFDDLPDLETAKNLKEMNYIDYMLEQSQCPDPVENKSHEGKVLENTVNSEEGNQVTKVEEYIDTSVEKKEANNKMDFDELD